MTDFSKIKIKVANTYLQSWRKGCWDGDVYLSDDDYLDFDTDENGNRIPSENIEIIVHNSVTLPPEISKISMKNILTQKPNLKIKKDSNYVLNGSANRHDIEINRNEIAYYYSPKISSYKHEDREISFIKIGKKKPPGEWDYAHAAAVEDYKYTGLWPGDDWWPEDEFLPKQNNYLVVCHKIGRLCLDTCIEQDKEKFKFRDWRNYKMITLNPGFLVNEIIDVAKMKIDYAHKKSYNESARESHIWEIRNTDADKNLKDGLLISYTYDPNQYDWDGVEIGINKKFIHIPKTALTKLKDKLFDIKKKYNI